jgi:hypothetical protein
MTSHFAIEIAHAEQPQHPWRVQAPHADPTMVRYAQERQKMASADEMTNALDVALATACAEYKDAVIELATREAAKDMGPARVPADIDRIHHARTRVIGLDAAREELSRIINEGFSLPST